MTGDRPPQKIERRTVVLPATARHEKKTVGEIIKEARAFIRDDIEILTLDPILGIDPKQSEKILKQLKDHEDRLEEEHTAEHGGEHTTEQENDFLLEDVIAWGMHRKEKGDQSNGFFWLGKHGAGYGAALTHDKKYRTDVLAILPGTKETPPIPVCINATTGSEKAPFKKFWLTLYDLTTTGSFGVLPMVSLRVHGAPVAQSAGLIGAPRITLAASRETALYFAREALKMKHAKELKEKHDPKDEKMLTSLPDKEKPLEEWGARERINGRRHTIEAVEESIRTHEIQIQFIVQMFSQFTFFREFATMHARRVDRAIYKAQNGVEAPEDDRAHPVNKGRAFRQKEEDGQWGACGATLPRDLGELETLRKNLTTTIDQLDNCIYAAAETYRELIQKLEVSEVGKEKPRDERNKRFARDEVIKDALAKDHSHIALMQLLENRELQLGISQLTYQDLGFERPPKTKTW